MSGPTRRTAVQRAAEHSVSATRRVTHIPVFHSGRRSTADCRCRTPKSREIQPALPENHNALHRKRRPVLKVAWHMAMRSVVEL